METTPKAMLYILEFDQIFFKEFHNEHIHFSSYGRKEHMCFQAELLEEEANSKAIEHTSCGIDELIQRKKKMLGSQ